ncbi:hypothetical protein [Streptomyces sp. NPDC127039]
MTLRSRPSDTRTPTARTAVDWLMSYSADSATVPGKRSPGFHSRAVKASP